MNTRENLARRARAGAATLSRLAPSESGPLAVPPPGSGLKPVLGDYGPPWLGRSVEFLDDVLALNERSYARFGPVSWFGGFGTKSVLAIGPDAVGEVLGNRDKAFANEPGWSEFIGPFFYRGIMLMDFEEHLAHRRIMQQAFTRSQLVRSLELMNPAIARGIARWRPDPRFPLFTSIKQLTLDIATEVFLGEELGDDAERLNRAFEATVVAGASVVRADVPGGSWHRGLQGRRVLQEYFRTRIPAKRAGNGDDLFSILCRAESEDGERFSDEDVVNHMIFLLMAAHDTTTITLSMMCYYLAKNPEWQERLRAESEALGTSQISYDDIDRLSGMDLAMKETLRLNAPVATVIRQAVKDTSLLGHYIPAGTNVFVSLYASMRMEPWWNEPHVFDPDRFNEHRREDKSHKYAWAPFGGNVHKCIGMYFGGMEVKAILHQLLLNNRWSVPIGYEPPMDLGTGVMPADGLPVQLQRLGEVSSSVRDGAAARVAIVTGGARGIGRAIAEHLAADGMRVAIGDIDVELAASTARQIDGAIGLPLDVTDADAFAAFIDTVEQELGPVDVLVNNAGIMPIGPFHEQDQGLAERAMNVNVHGPLNGVRVLLPRMLSRGGGHIVNIASTAGKIASPGSVLYSATKHAVVGMSDALRQEYAGSGIHVTTVLPSFTNTELISGTKGVRGIPTIEPDDVADAVLHAIADKRASVVVPRAGAPSVWLHGVLPARANDLLAKLFGADRMFLDVDAKARTAYDVRIGAAPNADLNPER